jgi:predicted Rossmann fold nucleotide-binding protein DprA/Smf involved in DNA uptake
MKIAIVGSRSFKDFDYLEKRLNALFSSLGKPALIISGGATGADSLAEQYAIRYGIPTKIHSPDWKRFGKTAGFLRNQLIVRDSDIIITFWDGESKGTAHTIALAEQAGKLVVHEWKGDRR